MTTWKVTEHKLIWDKSTRTWTQNDTVIATGLSKAKADSLLNQDRAATLENNHGH